MAKQHYLHLHSRGGRSGRDWRGGRTGRDSFFLFSTILPAFFFFPPIFFPANFFIFFLFGFFFGNSVGIISAASLFFHDVFDGFD